jgi:hypothetical protein
LLPCRSFLFLFRVLGAKHGEIKVHSSWQYTVKLRSHVPPKNSSLELD